jgi:hypothetical protein
MVKIEFMGAPCPGHIPADALTPEEQLTGKQALQQARAVARAEPFKRQATGDRSWRPSCH